MKHMEKITVQFDNEDITIRGDVDKSTGFIFYTCTFKNGDIIVLSMFDGDVLKLANQIGENQISNLDKLIECVNLSISQ